MADIYKGLTVKLGVDDTSLSKALRSAKNEAAGVYGELKKLDKALKLDPGNTKLLAQQQTDYRRQIESTEKQLKILKQAESEIGKEKLTSEQWTKLQSDIVLTEQKLKGYKQALADSVIQQGVANSALGNAGGVIESFGTKVDGLGRGMQAVGGTLTRTLTPAIIAAGTATVVAATTIDTSLTNVKKTVDGTDEQYQQLKASAIEFSKTNAVDASQILDIQALGAQLGFAIDELDEFGRVVSGLDIATNMDAETAATEMAQFANITKMSHGEISNYGSAIVGLGNNFATTESDISAMAMRLAAAGTQVKMSQADILGIATALTSMGVEAEAGGTAISTIMAQIDKDVAMSGSVMEGTSNLTQKEAEKVTGALETWASAAGMTAQEFSDAWKGDPVSALSALLSGMESATLEGGNMSVILQELGIDAVRQTDIMKRLAGNSELVGKAVAKSNDEWTKNTALQNEVDNRNESLAAQFEMLKNRVIAIADKVGGPLAKAFLDALDAAEPLLQSIADGAQAFADMDEEQQKLILTVVALAAAAGPLMNIIGGGITHIKDFGSGMQKAAEMLAKFDVATSSAARSTTTQATASTAAAGATTGLATSTKAASVAMGGLKAAIASTGVGLLVVAIGMLVGLVMDFVDANNKAADRVRKAGEANDALKRSLDGLDSGFESAKSKASDYAITADDVRGKTEEMTQAHKDLAKSLTDSMTEAGSNAGMLESYMGIIESLGTKSNLTSEEQAKLQEAVKQVNGACGTSFAVTNDQNGALYGQVDAIRAVVAAQQERIRYEAASDGWKEVLKQQEADLLEITRLEQQRNDLAEKNKGKTVSEQGENAQAYTETVNALNAARDAYNSTSETAKLYEQRVGQLGSSLGSSAAEIVEFSNATAAISESIGASGQSVDAFASSLSQCGVSTAELSSLTEDQLAALAQSYDGSTQSIIAKLQEFGLAAKVEGKGAASNLATGISEGTQQVLQAASDVTGKTLDQIGAECASFGIEGDAAIAAYATALASGSSQAEAAAAAAGVASGNATGQNYADALAAKRELAVASALQVTGMTIEQFNASAAQAGVEGDEATAAYAASVAARAGDAKASGETVAGAATGGLGTGDASSGGQLGDLFASGVAARAWNSKVSGEALAGNAASGAKSQNENASTWGEHLGGNFASGIRGAIEWVSNAATSLADAVWKVLGHTVPKEGPLRNGGKGEAEWGRHTVQNYISGVRSQIPELKKAMNEVANTASMPLASSESIRLSTAASASARKQSAPVVSVSVDGKDGITKGDVYDAMVAAMTQAARESGDTVIKVGEREVARVVAKCSKGLM